MKTSRRSCNFPPSASCLARGSSPPPPPRTRPGLPTEGEVLAEEKIPNRVFFGDKDLHTSYSTDAGMIGNTLAPEEAYRFARGQTVTSRPAC